MRLKTHLANSMAEAMAAIRRDSGDDAIIVSTEEHDGTVRVVVAIEEPDDLDTETGPDGVRFGRLAGSSQGNASAEAGYDTYGGAEDPIDLVHEALLAHGVPTRLLEQLIDKSFLAGSDDPFEALSQALRQMFGFHPLVNQRVNQPLVLVGAPGGGKTVTVAKLAARAVFAGRKARLITTDTVRAGGIEQLDAFARLMRLPMHTADTDDQLARLVAEAQPDETLIIDTPGVNPYSMRDLAELNGYIRATNGEAILVMAAGGDVVDAMEQAQEFARIGCTRMVVTRLDMVRRLGSMLAAADAAGLPFADCSTTPAVADGLGAVDPDRLARMLLPTPTSYVPAQTAIQGLRS